MLPLLSAPGNKNVMECCIILDFFVYIAYYSDKPTRNSSLFVCTLGQSSRADGPRYKHHLANVYAHGLALLLLGLEELLAGVGGREVE